MMKRDGDTVTLTLTSDQYSAINLALGIAAGWSSKENGAGSSSVRAWIRLADAVNEGNPNYRPYNVAAESDESA
jgi:hypothetical protein